MSDKIKIIGREVLTRGFGVLERFKLRRRRFDAKMQDLTRDFYDSGNSAAILLYDPTRACVLLIRQFRLAAYLADGRETMVEVCAGKLEGMDAGRRIVMEVMEETGFSIHEP